MNKTIIFILGALTGAAAGSVATYLLVKDKIEREAAEEIEMYAEHCDERIRRLTNKEDSEESEEFETDTEEAEQDEEIKNNEGVKKYHHYSGPVSSDGDRVFKDEKKEKEVTKEEVERKLAEEDAKLRVSEIDESEFLKTDDYSKETIDYFFPDETAFWAYNTDNETTVEAKYGKPLKDLIGNASRWLVDYTGEDGIGAAYFQNDDLKTKFEVIVHDSTGFNNR